MRITGYSLFLDGFEVEAEIGIHDFERGVRQRVAIAIEITLDPARLPASDEIAATFDYDWVRLGVLELVGSRSFDLQETLAREIVALLSSRSEISRVVVQTAKPDVFPDVAAVGCRLEAQR